MRKKTKIAKLGRELRKQARAPKHRYLLLTMGSAFLAERVARFAITEGWRLVKGEDPPRNPERLEVTWADAIAWTAATGLAMSAAGLLARRGAAIGWRRYVGRPIPLGSGKEIGRAHV